MDKEKQNKQITVRQHTIPKFLIKHFNNNVWVADGEKQEIKLRNPKNLTIIPNFYEKDDQKVNFIENKLALNESEVSKIIKKIIDTNDDIHLTPTQATTLVRFLWTMSDRTIRPLSILEGEPNDIWEAFAKARGGDVETVHEDLLVDLNIDIETEIDHYRKWRKSMLKKATSGKVILDGTLDSEYKIWDKAHKYSWRTFRSLTDYSASKILVISSEYDVNVLTNTFSFGQRDSYGRVMYYTFPISPKKSILVILENYSSEQNPFNNLRKASKRLSFKNEYLVKQHKIEPQIFFLSTISGLNEEQNFIIAKDLPSLFDIILKFYQYVQHTKLFPKSNHLWICKYIKENLNEEYQKQVKLIKKINSGVEK